MIRNIRPPYGMFNRPTLSRLIGWGYRLVMWNNIPPHWMQPLSWTIQQTLDQVQPGSVIVLHDGHGHGSNVAKIVDVIVPRLKDQGYQFVTIEHMQRRRTS
jgi:peptidoglycan/xylan/chitin deacetylase (PgdA/CDA1 family)